MAKNNNIGDLLKSVADAIRAKKGTTDLINPQNFDTEIASIPSGFNITKDIKFGYSSFILLPTEVQNSLSSRTNMQGMFYYCTSLSNISLPDLPNVTTMNECFAYDMRLKNVTVGSLPKVQDMYYCFANTGITSISLPELPNVTTMSQCFYMDNLVTNISITSLPKVQTMYSCFNLCSKLTSLSLPDLPAVTTLQGCFSQCTSLQTLTIGALNTALSNLSNCGLSTCTKLDAASLLNIIIALPQRTGTNVLTLGTTNLNKLAAAQKSIASSKGWTLN